MCVREGWKKQHQRNLTWSEINLANEQEKYMRVDREWHVYRNIQEKRDNAWLFCDFSDSFHCVGLSKTGLKLLQYC